MAEQNEEIEVENKEVSVSEVKEETTNTNNIEGSGNEISVETLKSNLQLQSKWTVWISKNSKKARDGNYECSLESIGSFDTIPQFWG